LACVIPAQLKLVGADEQESQSSGIEKLSESCLPELLSHSFSGAKPKDGFAGLKDDQDAILHLND